MLYNYFTAPLLIPVNVKAAGLSVIKLLATEAAVAAGIGDDDISSILDLGDKMLPEADQFMKAENKTGDTNNPFTKAFESNMGRGLAGVLGGVTYNWLEYPWELDYNARAPMGVKITMSLDVIHDIPPGIDHSGYNRAPLYNVGNIMKHVAGDPNGRTVAGEFNYNARSNQVNRYGKKEGK